MSASLRAERCVSMAAFGKADGGGRRLQYRCVLPLQALVTTLESTCRVDVVDISCSGVRIRGSKLPVKGSELEIAIDLVRAFGTVVWAANNECGVAFDGQISPMQLEALRLKCGLPCLAKLSPAERARLEKAIGARRAER